MCRATPNLAVAVLGVIFLMAGLPELRSQGGVDWNSPAPRQEMQSFQQFLANHPWISGKLREDPTQANKPSFLHHSPELAQFMNAHPYVQAGFKADAAGVMSLVQQAAPASPNDPANEKEMQDFQQFLSNHPWISRKLREQPSLANDKGFQRGAHEVPEFLNSHPFVQAQIRADADGFMKRMEDFSAQSPRQAAHSPHAQDYEALRLFLQSHKWIAEQLKGDPTLATTKTFQNKAKEFRQFLDAHPFMQDEFKQDARGTMDRALQPGGGEFF